MITRPPTFDGKAKAWRVELVKEKLKNWRPDYEATLDSYFLNCKWAHPAWEWYAISVIHLRDIPGVRPPDKHFAEASHEFIILSLNPRYIPNIEKFEIGEETLDFLTPPDLVHQVCNTTDDEAKKVCELIIQTITSGKASPDVDFRNFWQGSIDDTIKCLKTGKHKIQ